MMIVGIIALLAALASGRATKREEQKEGPAVDEPIDTGNKKKTKIFHFRKL